MSRLSDLASSPMIREFAVGAAQQAVAPVADFIAPTVNVATPVGRYKEYTSKHRFKIPNTLRPVGGRAVELGWTADDKTFNCAFNAIDYPIDIQEAMASEDMENALQEAAVEAAEVGGLAHETAVINAAVAALSAQNKTWNAGADPIADLDAAVYTVMKAAKYGSLMGVRIVFGADAFKGLKNHPNVRNKFVVVAGGGSAAVPMSAINQGSIGELIVGVPETRTSFMVADISQEGETENVQFLLSSKILVFACRPSPTRRDPSFMKTFRLSNQWMVPGTYMRDDGRAEVAKFDWSEDVKVTNSAACVRLNVAAA